MSFFRHIPNVITLGNLFCGTIATVFAVNGDFKYAAIFVLIGIGLDFFDGFFARLLNVSGELGKQLDSLADMVTSGVVPGVIMFKLIQINLLNGTKGISDNYFDISLIGFIITLAACYRLANFNIDTRQTDSFIGLPTPAMCLVVISLPIIKESTTIEFVLDLLNNNYFLITLTWVLSFLMNSEIRLFSLKIKNFSVSENWFLYLFIIISIALILLFNFLAIPIIIILYVVTSIIKNLTS
jgi:CDP-diacylglycerol--serine O-phosphatidyltransferase